MAKPQWHKEHTKERESLVLDRKYPREETLSLS